MTVRGGLLKCISYAMLVALCAIVVGSSFWLIMGSRSLALLFLAVGSTAWGVTAGALRASGVALPAIALVAELAVGFEFKRIYVLDYFGGPPPRSLDVLWESIFVSDLFVVALIRGFGWAGWRWQLHRVAARV